MEETGRGFAEGVQELDQKRNFIEISVIYFSETIEKISAIVAHVGVVRMEIGGKAGGVCVYEVEIGAVLIEYLKWLAALC